jgi:hypothetical protein
MDIEKKRMIVCQTADHVFNPIIFTVCSGSIIESQALTQDNTLEVQLEFL